MARLRVRNEFELQDLVDRLERPPGLIARDFALMTIVARLADIYGPALCFKGGFVLRHVHGHERFSRDIDATRTRPPRHKLDSGDFTSPLGDGRVSVEISYREDVFDPCLAMILARDMHDPVHVRELADEKFKLVKTGDHHARIVRRISGMGSIYDAAVQAVAPDAPDYHDASALVTAQLGRLLR